MIGESATGWKSLKGVAVEWSGTGSMKAVLKLMGTAGRPGQGQIEKVWKDCRCSGQAVSIRLLFLLCRHTHNKNNGLFCSKDRLIHLFIKMSI